MTFVGENARENGWPKDNKKKIISQQISAALRERAIDRVYTIVLAASIRVQPLLMRELHSTNVHCTSCRSPALLTVDRSFGSAADSSGASSRLSASVSFKTAQQVRHSSSLWTSEWWWQQLRIDAKFFQVTSQRSNVKPQRRWNISTRLADRWLESEFIPRVHSESCTENFRFITFKLVCLCNTEKKSRTTFEKHSGKLAFQM